jgi:hypothetical protein
MYTNSAIFCKDSEKIFYQSDYLEGEAVDEIPEKMVRL